MRRIPRIHIQREAPSYHTWAFIFPWSFIKPSPQQRIRRRVSHHTKSSSSICSTQTVQSKNFSTVCHAARSITLTRLRQMPLQQKSPLRAHRLANSTAASHQLQFETSTVSEASAPSNTSISSEEVESSSHVERSTQKYLAIKQELEQNGIYPVDEDPDVYVAQTFQEAELLSRLFQEDSFVGFDTKLMVGRPCPTRTYLPSDIIPPPHIVEAVNSGAIHQQLVGHPNSSILGVPHSSNHRPVSLIQIANHLSSVIFQIRRIVLQEPYQFPPSLLKILKSKSIAKAGIHSTRNFTQIRRSYGIWCSGGLDLLEIARTRGLQISDPFKRNESTDQVTISNSSVEIAELGYLLTPQLTPRTSNTDRSLWDFDMRELPYEMIRETADEAFIRYLVAYKMIEVGILPETLFSKPSFTKKTHVENVFAMIQKKCSNMKVQSWQRYPVVSINRLAYMIKDSYKPWKLVYDDDNRSRLCMRVIRSLIEDGKVRIAADPNVENTLTVEEVGKIDDVSMRRLYVEVPIDGPLNRTKELAPRDRPEKFQKQATKERRGTGHVRIGDPSLTLSDIAAPSEKQTSSLCNPLQAPIYLSPEIVDTLTNDFYEHLGERPEFLIRPHAAFRPTTTDKALRKIITKTFLPHRHKFTDEKVSNVVASQIIDKLIQQNKIVTDFLDPNLIAVVANAPSSKTLATIFSTPVPDILINATHGFMARMFVNNQIVPLESVYKVLFTASPLVSWVRNWWIKFKLNKDPRKGKGLVKLSLDYDDGIKLSEWVVKGLVQKGLIRTFTREEDGKEFAQFKWDIPGQPQTSSSDSNQTTKKSNYVRLFTDWHPSILPIQHSYDPHSLATDDSISAIHDISMIYTRLRALHPHLSEFQLGGILNRLKHNIPAGQLLHFRPHSTDLSSTSTIPSPSPPSSRSTLIQPDRILSSNTSSVESVKFKSQLTDTQYYRIIDSLVARNILIPTIRPGYYLFNHYVQLPSSNSPTAPSSSVSHHSSSNFHVSSSSRHDSNQNVPNPYSYLPTPDFNRLKQYLSVSTQSEQTETATPFTLRESIREFLNTYMDGVKVPRTRLESIVENAVRRLEKERAVEVEVRVRIKV
ncbi:hypothetical protein BKA69DRAFT_1093108 [Paraphysoderma sedebokerense]|nr:hypothetical protein BKA69DRAFT_1093108 [Paraphysoderma sedebokerense]